MQQFYPWLGNLHELGLSRPAVGVACTLAALVCGSVIGLERERRDKPAGLRTVVLIALGTTIFTLVSLLLAESRNTADPARLASQILPGIGFLGAGAIIRARGTVVGLTTGATIWAVAAVGVTIGSGHIAAAVAFTAVILFTLTALQYLERSVNKRCRYQRTRIVYRPDAGKTRPRLQYILDQEHVPDQSIVVSQRGPGEHVLETRVCSYHREHRRVLKELAEVPEVLALEIEGAA
jgi:putative Mg2+ transporter-C (MgtC) family protein